MYLIFCPRTCPKTLLQCFALEERKYKAKHCRNVLGRVLWRKNKIQIQSFSLVLQSSDGLTPHTPDCLQGGKSLIFLFLIKNFEEKKIEFLKERLCQIKIPTGLVFFCPFRAQIKLTKCFTDIWSNKWDYFDEKKNTRTIKQTRSKQFWLVSNFLNHIQILMLNFVNHLIISHDRKFNT